MPPVVPDPVLLREDLVITRPRLTGGRGSDSQQISIDFGVGDADNALAGTPVTLGDLRSPLSATPGARPGKS